ncbi:hypothetical protein F5148DRAFT_1199283 [Russula earlei]|uniref:Uncharacterized protein n=1 Tax=Russula earlei TaxID=71964 RepID=A0ACC0UAA3_9AGAM|nr:hypothetical protein F5148DRAFT_1199283 [Russula earlei]
MRVSNGKCPMPKSILRPLPTCFVVLNDCFGGLLLLWRICSTRDVSSMSRDQGLGAFIANPLGFVARQLPSANENRGNLRLDDAHRIAIEYESVIDPKDREAIESTITHAREMKTGLDSKRGIARFLQYCRAATHAQRFANSILDRAQFPSERVSSESYFPHQGDTLGAPPPYLAVTDPTFQSVANVTKSLYRCYLSCKEIFPGPLFKLDWASPCLCLSCRIVIFYSSQSTV